MFLICDVLLDNFEGCATDGGDEIRVRPQRRKPAIQERKLTSQQSRGPPLDLFDESMYPVLRVDTNEKLNVVGHRLEFNQLGPAFGADLSDDLLQAGFYWAVFGIVDENPTTILGAPDHVVGAPIDDVVVGFDVHDAMIQARSIIRT